MRFLLFRREVLILAKATTAVDGGFMLKKFVNLLSVCALVSLSLPNVSSAQLSNPNTASVDIRLTNESGPTHFSDFTFTGGSFDAISDGRSLASVFVNYGGINSGGIRRIGLYNLPTPLFPGRYAFTSNTSEQFPLPDGELPSPKISILAFEPSSGGITIKHCDLEHGTYEFADVELSEDGSTLLKGLIFIEGVCASEAESADQPLCPPYFTQRQCDGLKDQVSAVLWINKEKTALESRLLETSARQQYEIQMWKGELSRLQTDQEILAQSNRNLQFDLDGQTVESADLRLPSMLAQINPEALRPIWI